MNQAHIHLLITHLPIFGSMFGGLVLAHGLWSKSNDTIIAAYHVFIISSLGAGIAYFTGEAAEEIVEHFQGVVEATIKTHEEFAQYAFISLIILGFISIFGLFLTFKKSLLSRTAAFIILWYL
jgi:membrane protein YqaA with SNARE-associated domain